MGILTALFTKYVRFYNNIYRDLVHKLYSLIIFSLILFYLLLFSLLDMVLGNLGCFRIWLELALLALLGLGLDLWGLRWLLGLLMGIYFGF